MPPPPLSAMTVVVDSPTLFRQQANRKRQSGFQFPNLEQHSTGFGFSDLCGGTGGEFESDEWMKSLMDGKDSTGAEKRERIWKKRDEKLCAKWREKGQYIYLEEEIYVIYLLFNF
ncbi:GRAS domain-containing protein [Forsythia ovata]|uniref:GRAS domain-containing protein n=1 Tax=Forsythia ovata TaxID=205694 RepID=A0ABD1RM81_9LAMI